MENQKYWTYFLISSLMVILISTVVSINLYIQSDYVSSSKRNVDLDNQVLENTSSSDLTKNELTNTDEADGEDTENIPKGSKKSSSDSESRSSGGGSSSNEPAPIQNPVVNIPSNTATSPTPIPNNTHLFSAQVCNANLINNFGFDVSYIIDAQTCNLLNTLYTAGIAAGNIGDMYYNLDNKHVNFCIGWTPNPECPQQYRLFFQHGWLFSDQGRITNPISPITVGQASYSGANGHGIANTYYQNQQNANEAYRLYTNNNLYVYPSLEDDGYVGNKNSIETLTNPVPDNSKVNIANTPYVISSKQIDKPGTDYYMIHDASGSELPFVKLAMIGLASFKPEIKQQLAQQINAQGTAATFLVPTLQMLIRYSHKTVNTNADYLSNTKIHRGAYLAHDFVNGMPQPAYDAMKMVTIANSLTLNDIPPLVQLKVISENFDHSEKLFDTPGAIARSVPYNTNRTIVVNAQSSFDITGQNNNMEYVWKTIEGSNVNIIVNPQNPAEATIEFYGASSTQRTDVFVFVKKTDGKYYSVPGIISEYIHP